VFDIRNIGLIAAGLVLFPGPAALAQTPTPKNASAAPATTLPTVQVVGVIPLPPRNRVVLDVEYAVTPQWKIGADAKFVGSQFLVGDASNQEPKLPGYGVVNLADPRTLSPSPGRVAYAGVPVTF
jgi:hypothetical protein